MGGRRVGADAQPQGDHRGATGEDAGGGEGRLSMRASTEISHLIQNLTQNGSQT